MGAHDALFKHTFSVPEHAAAELAYVLPRALASRIVWSSLRLEPGSFVDAELAERHTDLLFSAELVGGGEVFLYLLFEHQSNADPWMPLRMASYTVKILDGVRARSPGAARLPIVIPVVLHHGRGGWTGARSLHELYTPDAELLDGLGDRVLGLRIVVDDLTSIPASAIAARSAPALVRVVLGVLRDGRERSIEELITRWGALMIEAARAVGREALTTVMRYLMDVREIDDPNVLLAAAREHGGVELEEIAMNAFDRVKAEGKAEGKAELVLRQLRLRFGELTPGLTDRVRRATPDELDAMADRILAASSAVDVVG